MSHPPRAPRGVRTLGLLALCGLSAACSSTTDPSPNPIPVLTLATPSMVVAGSSSHPLTLTGSGFATSSMVRVGGSHRVTRFVATDRLEIDLAPSDLIGSGTLGLTVFTPPPGGGLSNTIELHAVAPLPTLDSVTPSVLQVGAVDTELVFRGTGFLGGASATRIVLSPFGPAPMTLVRRVSSTELRLTMVAANFTHAYQVWAWVETPGGGTSERVLFTVEEASR